MNVVKDSSIDRGQVTSLSNGLVLPPRRRCPYISRIKEVPEAFIANSPLTARHAFACASTGAVILGRKQNP